MKFDAADLQRDGMMGEMLRTEDGHGAEYLAIYQIVSAAIADDPSLEVDLLSPENLSLIFASYIEGVFSKMLFNKAMNYLVTKGFFKTRIAKKECESSNRVRRFREKHKALQCNGSERYNVTDETLQSNEEFAKLENENCDRNSVGKNANSLQDNNKVVRNASKKRYNVTNQTLQCNEKFSNSNFKEDSLFSLDKKESEIKKKLISQTLSQESKNEKERRNTINCVPKKEKEENYGLPFEEFDDEDTFAELEEGKKQEKIQYKFYQDEWNRICKTLPKLRLISENRRRAIKACLNQFSQAEIIEAMRKTEASDYLSGRNGKWFGCGFDWVFTTGNMLKVLEGNYDNREESENAAKMLQKPYNRMARDINPYTGNLPAGQLEEEIL